MKYTIDCDDFNEGGSAEFYRIKEDKTLGFKQFRNKSSATSAYKKQKLLSKFGLAPKVYGKVCKLLIDPPEDIELNKNLWRSNWGYVTEKAKILDDKIMYKRLKEIQSLVEEIHKKTKLKFWDCHYWNVGYVRRNNKAKLVCIDTGKESFWGYCNAWGFSEPGPKCNYCDKFQCRCGIN